jgi:hypothetical protein
MTEWGTKLRMLVSENFGVAVAIAVLLALVGTGLIYATYVDPGTETTQEVQGVWESSAGYSHQATVVEDNRVFPVGRTLSDRSTYYTRLAPELNGTFRYGVDANSGQLAVDLQSRLIYRSVSDGGQELWRIEEPLGNESTTIASGETATLSFDVNVTETAATVEEIQQDLGANAGQTEVFVRTDASAEGTIAGGPASQDASYDMQLTPETGTYGVSADSETVPHERTETVTREVQHGPVRSALGPLALLVGLAGVVGLAAGRRDDWFEVAEDERVAASFADEREEFDDWISRGTVPERARERPIVEIESLEDLVDVAVDASARVLEDVDDGRYYVLADGTCYRYEPPARVTLPVGTSAGSTEKAADDLAAGTEDGATDGTEDRPADGPVESTEDSTEGSSATQASK